MLILAAAQRIDWPSIAFWLILFAVLIAAAGFVIWRIRRAVREAEDITAPAFTLQDLREMRARGDLTEEEYQAARHVALGEAAGGSKTRDGISDNPPKGVART